VIWPVIPSAGLGVRQRQLPPWFSGEKAVAGATALHGAFGDGDVSLFLSAAMWHVRLL
jgi:hypothetical protein